MTTDRAVNGDNVCDIRFDGRGYEGVSQVSISPDRTKVWLIASLVRVQPGMATSDALQRLPETNDVIGASKFAIPKGDLIMSLAMEYVRGRTLEAFPQRHGPLRAARAPAVARREDVVHQGVAPRNAVIDETGEPLPTLPSLLMLRMDRNGVPPRKAACRRVRSSFRGAVPAALTDVWDVLEQARAELVGQKVEVMTAFAFSQ